MPLTDYLTALRGRSATTAKNYECFIRGYSRHLGKEPDEIVADVKDGRLDPYGFFGTMVGYLVGGKKAPKTVGLYLTAWRGFLGYEDISIDTFRFRAKVKAPVREVISLDSAPDENELRLLLNNSPARTRVITLLAATSGMRCSEISALHIGHIKFGENGQPTRITVPAVNAKTKRSRLTFCSDETAEALRLWLRDRLDKPDEYVFYSKSPNTPSSTDAIESLFVRALVRNRLRDRVDPDSPMHRLHFHSLRKFFNSRLKSLGAPPIAVEMMMGHTTGLSQNYDRLTPDELARAYEPMQRLVLTTVADTGKLSDLTEEVGNLKLELEKRNRIIEKLVAYVPALHLESLREGVRDLGFDPDEVVRDAALEEQGKTPLMTARKGGKKYDVSVSQEKAIRILQRFLRGETRLGRLVMKAGGVRRTKR